ncbi:MAG: RNA polymerase sigma-I factor [Paenisporosarcina sp.]|uniref:RNA polymerase sigma-I factor n=1 Tax=Paenisporosarcina sp. TaxID=1932001 RepID=UPI003C78E81D
MQERGELVILASIQGIFLKKQTKQNVEALVIQAKNGNKEVHHELLSSYTPFMKKTASFVCKRYISEQDDEYSIAMLAFNEAIEHYELGKNASFLTFAHLLIRRKLIDFIRKESRRKEIHIGQIPFENKDLQDSFDILESSHSFEQFTAKQQAEERRHQIAVFESLLKPYGLSFQELVKVSPSHEDSRQTAIQIAQIIVETDEFYEMLLTKKRLPMKELEELVNVSRKTIERHRKYIVAIVILLKSDLHYIKDYLKGRMS